MRRLRRRMIKGGAAGLTLAVLMGVGTVFGGAVYAAESQEDMVVEELSDKSGESSEELVNNTTDAIETGTPDERVVLTSGTDNTGAESADETEKMNTKNEELKQSSGVSATQSYQDESNDPSVKATELHTDTELKAAPAEDTQVKEDVPVKEGWIIENGVYKYYKAGEAYTGWHYMGAAEGEKIPHWSYFAKDGSLYTGWHNMGTKEGEKTAHWSYFGDNGWLRTGWVQLGKGTANPDGNSNRHWSYFGDNGWLRTGWVQLGKGTSNPDGNSNRHWSYFGENGWLRTGMQTMGTASNPDGGSKQHLSYFGGNGWLVVNKLFTEKNVQYIADSRGWATKVQTEHEKVMARAIQLVEKITNESMTKEQKLRACYIHIRDKYPEYNPRIPHFAGEGWHITYANDIFINKGGNCISVGAAFAYMAAAIGYENVYAVNGTGHGWAEVNGLVYDAEWERHHAGNFYAVSYNDTIGNQKYKWIFGSANPYARVKLS